MYGINEYLTLFSRRQSESQIDRQNILNNDLAVEEIQTKSGMEGIVWEDKVYVTREMTANFFDVDIRTISRYIEQNGEELSKNGYDDDDDE